MKLTVTANAKINLFLDICGTVPSGYHSLFSVMQSVDIADSIALEEGAGSGIAITCSDADIPCDGRNTAYKAAEAFCSEAGINNPSISIHIDKKIPHNAGLAGGSADAAAVLAGLNELHGRPFCDEKLCSLAMKVGSDVPFCLCGGTQLVQNTGDILTKLPALADCSIVIAKPKSGVSTAAAYAEYDKTKCIYHPNSVAMLDCCACGDLRGICENAGNVFEQVIEVVERVEIKAAMRKNHVLLCQMSGSGPSVFGIFKDERCAKSCAASLKPICADVFVTKPARCGVLIKKSI